jgi:Cdc6-like AAA superfamily ATPase
VVVIPTAWINLWKGSDSYLIGTSRVHILLGDPAKVVRDKQIEAVVNPSTNLLKRPSVSGSVAADFSGLFREGIKNGFWQWDIEAPENSKLRKAKAGEFRVRLGDVVYGGKFNALNVFHAAIYDDRFVIEDESGLPAPAKAAAGWSLIGMAHAGKPPEPEKTQRTPSATQKQAAPQEQLPPRSPKAFGVGPSLEKKVSPREQLTPREEPVPKTDVPPPERLSARRTSARVVTSATMVALLQAELRRISSIALPAIGSDPGGLSSPESVKAIIQGITRVRTHLSSVRHIYLVLPAQTEIEKTDIEKMVQLIAREGPWRTMLDLVSTPLALPAPAVLLEVTPIPVKKLPSDRAQLFNPAFLISGKSSLIPMLAFLVISVMVLGLYLLTLPLQKVQPSLQGTLGGVMSALGLFGLLFILSSLWRWSPEGWIENVPAFLFTAIVAGALNGVALGWLRTRGILRQSDDSERDNILRSVLHRDTPIEEIAEDRLGFGPLVMALHRFLDNPDTEPPVVLSVNGPWGSGKSSVMKMLANELRKTGRFRTVWFNAWRYHKEEQILAAFLQTIARQLSEGWGPMFALRLGLARFKRQTYFQYLGLLIPVALVVIAVLYPETGRLIVASVSAGAIGVEKLGGDLGKAAYVLGLGVAGLSGIGVGGVSLLRLLLPFRLRFKKLYTIRDQSQRIGFIDEFTREFKLYREAVGYQKFLIVIDDLDRCPPDKVVEVLKTINLIVTSGDGAGRSYFLLGFDAKYIVKSIEIYFKDFTKSGDVIDHRFASEYLKKMVTLSVSVPRATTEGVQRLLDGIDGARERESDQDGVRLWRDKLSARLRRPPIWVSRLLLAAATVAVLILLVRPTPPKEEQFVSSDQTINAPSPGGRATVIKMPDFDPPIPQPIEWSYWIPVGLLVVAFLAVGYRIAPSVRVEDAYRREPQDSEQFKMAIGQTRQLLPANPRDIVRLINLMRMEYLVQNNPEAPFPGHPLDELESVSFTVLKQRCPEFFNPGILEEEVIPIITSSVDERSVIEVYHKVRESVRVFSGIASDVHRLEEAGARVEHMVNAEKLRRYVEVNRFVLEVVVRPDFEKVDRRERENVEDSELAGSNVESPKRSSGSAGNEVSGDA